MSVALLTQFCFLRTADNSTLRQHPEAIDQAEMAGTLADVLLSQGREEEVRKKLCSRCEILNSVSRSWVPISMWARFPQT